MHQSPDPELQWHKELMTMQTDNRDLNSLNPLEHYSALSRVMRKESADKAEVNEWSSLIFFLTTHLYRKKKL